MHVSLETTQGLERRLSLIIPTESVRQALKKELINIMKSVCIDGFRKGKVPRHIIEKRYGTAILQDVLSKMMQRSFIEVITEKKINLAGRPNYLPGKYKKGEDFDFSVKFEVYPDIELKALENIKIEKPLVEVTDADINTMLETLRKQQATWKKSDHETEADDRVTIDFTGSIDGKEFEGGTASNFVLIIGQGRMIPGFEESLAGHKAGERFIININFPEDYHTANLQGKAARFTIFLKKVEERELPELTEEFIKRFGVTNGLIDGLRAEVRKNMERELKGAVRNHIKTQIINGLLKTNNIDVPRVLIDDEVDFLRRQAAHRASSNTKKELDLPRELFEEQAKRRVIVSLLLGKVIAVNSLHADEERVKTLIKEMAYAYEDPQKVVKLYSKNKHLMNNIYHMALEDQAVETILARAQITEKNITFGKLMNQFQQV